MKNRENSIFYFEKKTIFFSKNVLYCNYSKGMQGKKEGLSYGMDTKLAKMDLIF